MIQLNLPNVLGTDHDPELLQKLFDAHAKSAADNENASTCACLNAGIVTGRLENGLASAILALGGHHAPIRGARTVYTTWVKADVENAIATDKLIPGFGNSFFKTGIDPAWSAVDEHLANRYPDHYARIKQLSVWVSEAKQTTLYPNAALYSAVVCEILGVYEGTEVSLLILARLPVWTKAWSDWSDNHRLLHM